MFYELLGYGTNIKELLTLNSNNTYIFSAPNRRTPLAPGDVSSPVPGGTLRAAELFYVHRITCVTAS